MALRSTKYNVKDFTIEKTNFGYLNLVAKIRVNEFQRFEVKTKIMDNEMLSINHGDYSMDKSIRTAVHTSFL